MTITATSDVRVRTISDDGVAALLSGTHLEGFAPVVIAAATQYGVDPTFFLGYVEREAGWMAYPGLPCRQMAVAMNNPFDIVCVNAPCNGGTCGPTCSAACGDPSGNQFASGCVNPGNGWCYTSYADLGTGIGAAFWQTRTWFTRDGLAPTWGALLAIAGFGPAAIANILAEASSWTDQYPYGGGGCLPQDCEPGWVWDAALCLCIPTPRAISLPLVLAGAGLAVGSGYVLWRSVQ